MIPYSIDCYNATNFLNYNLAKQKLELIDNVISRP
jgi:hypothetical protein